MQEELNRIIDEINSHSNWSKNVKIRYAYIELGKLVSKDAMFFYTIQNNLLSKDKEDIRYPKEEIERIINSQDLFDYKVVCKNAADMLIYILKNCGIEAERRKTLVFARYKDLIIPHYFVIATGDEDKKYFMTLNPDLPNIKIGKKTSKFAYEIKYHIDNDYMDGNNFGKQYYEGDEVEYSVLSDEEIRKLDLEIGYVQNQVMHEDGNVSLEYTDYFYKMIEEAYKNNKDYIDYVAHTTVFYNIISRLLNGNKTLNDILKEKPSLNREKVSSLSFKISDINSDTWDDVKDYILSSVISKFYNEYGIRSEEDFDELLHNRQYDDIRRIINKELYSKTDKEKINKLGNLNPFFIMKQMIELFKIIDTFDENKNLSEEKMAELKNKFGKDLTGVSLAFVNKKILPVESSLSSTYLTNKLIYAFETIFDTGHKTAFNDIGLAEQVVIVKELLEIILSDIKRDDNLPNYDDQKSPLRNRIISTVLFDRETKNPYYLIYVKNTNYGDNANVMLVYDFKENKLYTDKSPIDVLSDYYVIKDADMRLIIEEFGNKKEEEKNFRL